MLAGAALIAAVAWYASGAFSGQTEESAEAGLLAVPGISAASVTTDGTRSGFQVETSTTVEISVEPGFTVPDPAALVDYLVAMAWSANTDEANWAIRVQVLSTPQISILDAVDAAGWSTRSGIANSPERASVRAEEVKDRLGNWPGSVPDLPDGLLVAPASTPVP